MGIGALKKTMTLPVVEEVDGLHGVLHRVEHVVVLVPDTNEDGARAISRRDAGLRLRDVD